MTFNKTLLAIAIAMISTNQVSAQALEELQTTKVTAEKSQQDRAVSDTDIQTKISSDLDDLVRYLPGVVTVEADDRWGGTGFNIRGVDDDRVAVSVDGLSQGEALQYNGGQAYGYFKGGRNGIEIETLKKVDISKGADSVLSGSGAVGGSVRYTTKDAADFLKAEGDDSAVEINTSYSGKSEETMLSVTAAGRIGATEALIVATQRQGHEFKSHDDDGADIEGSEREIPNEQDRESKNILAKISYNFSPKQSLGFVAEYRDYNTETDAKSYNGPWYIGRIGDDTSKRSRIGIFHKAEINTAIADSFEWQLNSQNIDFEAITKQSVTFYGGITPRVSTRSFDQKQRQFKLEINKLISASSQHNIDYGFEILNKQFSNEQLQYQTKPGQDTVHSVSQALVPSSTVDILNFHVQDKIVINNNTSISIGARYDDYDYKATANQNFADTIGDTLNSQSFDAISWSLGADHTLSEGISISAKISKGFRAPTIEELYTRSGTEDNWRTAPNPDLDVETATNYEITLELKNDWSITKLTPFYSQYDNFIESRTLSRVNAAGETDTYSINDNIGKSTISGLEISSYFDLSQAFNLEQGLFANMLLAYTDGEKDDGEPLLSVQPLTINAGLGYHAPDNTWDLTAQLNYIAEKDQEDAYYRDSDGVRQEASYLSNSAITLDLIANYNVNENLSLRAGFYNITDKEYYTWDGIRFIGQDDLRPGIGVQGDGIKRYSEPGRNFSIRADYRF